MKVGQNPEFKIFSYSAGGETGFVLLKWFCTYF